MSSLYVQETEEDRLARVLKRDPYDTEDFYCDFSPWNSNFPQKFYEAGWLIDEWIEAYLKARGDINRRDPDKWDLIDDFFLEIDKSPYGYRTTGDDFYEDN